MDRGRNATFEASARAVGRGAGAGTSINVAWHTRGLNSRPGDAEYLAVWSEILMPMATEFAPDLVIVAAGFDAAEGDPLGGCHVTPQGYAEMTRQLMRLANGRLVVALEGGYSLSATRVSAAACMGALLGMAPRKPPEPKPATPTLSPTRARSARVAKKKRAALEKRLGKSASAQPEQANVASPGRPPLSKAARQAINETVSVHSRYWRCLRPQQELADSCTSSMEALSISAS